MPNSDPSTSMEDSRLPSCSVKQDESNLAYWQQQLEGASIQLDMPTDRPRNSHQTYRLAQYNQVLPVHYDESIRELEEWHGTTLFATLLAALNALLYRYTNQEDLVVWGVDSSCNRLDSATLTSRWSNVLPLRVDVSGNPTACTLLGRVKQVIHEASLHHELPFAEMPIAEAFETNGSEQKQSQLSPPQVMFSLLDDSPETSEILNTIQAALEVVGEECRTIVADTSVSDASTDRVNPSWVADVFLTELTMIAVQRSDGLQLELVYNKDLYNATTIERLAGHFETLLGGIVADPDRTIGQLPILTEPERHQLLVEWNDRAIDYPCEKCIYELFEEQVRRTPDNVAVVFADQQLTYAELNSRTNQLANYLREQGVGPDVLVGLCMARSLEMVIGVLGILKAGGAYVPVDAASPPERARYIFSDSKAKVILSELKLANRFFDCPGEVVCIEDAFERPSVERKNIPIGADNLAYVIYTSGTTGKPKGTLIDHHNVVRLFRATKEWFQFGDSDVWTLFHSMAFDFSVWELWGALLHGGKLIVVPYAVSRSPKEFHALLQEEEVTVLNQTPSAFEQLMQADLQLPAGSKLSLRCIIFGGEPLTIEKLRPWFAKHGDTRPQLINMYGITETTVHVTYKPLLATDLGNASSSNIGIPITDLQVLLLDRNQLLVPIGVEGEICVAGAGLARGYLNRPDLTAEKFIPHPFESGKRVYRSGDQARWHEDGNLEFLGRFDEQVKIRGFRIELGEIEAVLSEHEAVGQCVVLLREDRPDDKRLVAYWVPKEGNQATVTSLREQLAFKLPDYMVPSTFIQLESLPLTPNGKLDRKSLPVPDMGKRGVGVAYTPPRDGLEVQLAAIWTELLGIDRIGIHDNFFELGGHSLLATQVVARIGSVLNKDLSVRKLFELPTIGELSAQLATAQTGLSTTSQKQLSRREHSADELFPLSFAQQRLWFLEQLEGELVAYNMPYSMRLVGPLDLESLRQAFATVVQRHEPLRTTFAMHDGEPVQVIGTVSQFELPLIDLSELPSAQRAAEILRLSREEADRPFDLTQDMMLRTILLRLADEEHVLLVTLHHIASDGWSLAVLWHELGILYNACCQNEDNPLPELPIQYADYAVWQRDQLQGERLTHLTEYWQQQLSGMAVLELPTDRSRPPLPSYQGARHNFELPGDLVDPLQQLSRIAGVTLHMTLLAAFQTLLSRYSGQEDITVGTPTAGRSHIDLEDQIGFFVNMLALRTDLSGSPTFHALLERVREVSLGAYEHQDMPFEKLVEQQQTERHRGRSPLVQVVFQLQEFDEDELELRGLDVLFLADESRRVRFDLEVYLWKEQSNLRGEIVYSSDLFDASTIERLAGHFQTLLVGIVADPNRPIGQLPILTEPERHQLLVEWNDTAVDYPRDECIHELFEEQVRRSPDRVAVVFADQQLTYAELNARANQLANYLRKQGVQRETLVGICLDRSPDMIVGVLGILKAGGVYVPLDPQHPTVRHTQILTDTGAPVLVTTGAHAGMLRDYAGRTVLLDEDRTAIGACESQNLCLNTGAQDLAYIMYTSGSTGSPKGTRIVHRGVVRLVHGTNYVQIDPHDVFLQFATLSFDASTFEIWAPLLNGACLVLAPPGLPSLEELGQTIHECGVTTLWLTAGLFQQLVDYQLKHLAGVRQLLTGGDVVSPAHARKVLDQFPHCSVINGYGPTENTTFTCCYRMECPEDVGHTVSIGQPIASTQVYVLDSYGELQPIGVAGELCVGGDGLARDYLHDAQLTNEKFVDHPFSEDPEARLYRTGDQVRWLNDGILEFLGRLDHQVKLRGFRIELGEIEVVLMRYPSIKEAIVLPIDDAHGEKRLIAYLVGDSGKDPQISEIREYLAQELPRYMMPAEFFVLEHLPLTTNGKVDRKTLLELKADFSHEDAPYIAPHNAVEKSLAAIWQKILKTDQVGIQDKFFDLGGHSLLLLQLAAEIQSIFGKRISVVKFYEADTIVSQLALIQSVPVESHASSLVALNTAGQHSPMILMPGAGGHASHFLALEQELRGRHPVYSIQLESGDEVPLRHTMKELASECVKVLEESELKPPFHLLGHSFGGMLAYEVARQLENKGLQVGILCIIDTGPSDPSNRSLLELMTMGYRFWINFPNWIWYFLIKNHCKEMPIKIAQNFRSVLRHLRSLMPKQGQDQKGPELEEIWAKGTIPTYERAIWKASIDAFFAYDPGKYGGKITLFRARVCPLFHSHSSDLGWSRKDVGQLEVLNFPGDHLSIMREPNCRLIAKQLSELLNDSSY